MDFKQSLTIELNGQEVATIVTALGKLPAEVSYELLKKIERLDELATEQLNKGPAPDLKMVSGNTY